MLPSMDGVGIVKGSTMSMRKDPATTVAQMRASLHSRAVDFLVLDQSRLPTQLSFPWRSSQSPHQGKAPMIHWSFILLRPNAKPSSTCITVNSSRLIPGTNRKMIQYHGRWINSNHDKKCSPGMAPFHDEASGSLRRKRIGSVTS